MPKKKSHSYGTSGWMAHHARKAALRLEAGKKPCFVWRRGAATVRAA